MLVSTNSTISVERLGDSGEKRVFSQILSGIRVYINQNGEEIVEGYDNQPAFFAHRMLTNGMQDIQIGDRITDQNSQKYEVRGKAKYSDHIGKHDQYLLIRIYE